MGSQRALVLGPHCPTTWPSCALGPTWRKPVLRGCLSVELLQSQDGFCHRVCFCSGLERTPETVYPSGWSKTPWVALECSVRFGALSGILATSLLCRVSPRVLLGSGSCHRTLSLWVSQFKSLPIPQSP